MKAWKLNQPRDLQFVSEDTETVNSGFCKVRITKVGITRNDYYLFNGKFPVDYPIIMGRSAIGIVTDISEEEHLKKGDRVVISPYIPCFNCINCREGNYDKCLDFSYAGVDKDGFLKDFAVVPITNLYLIPEAVSDEKAIFIPYIALALSILDRIELDIGKYIGIGSCSTIGLILGQLCKYYQTVPIMFDKQPNFLNKSKDFGLYFSFLNNETTHNKVLQVTCGKMIDSFIHIRQETMPINDCFKYLKNSGELIVSSVATLDIRNESIPLKYILEREIEVLPVPYSNENFESAINFLVNNWINVIPLISGETPAQDFVELIKKDVDNEPQPIFLHIVSV